jgi:hypothetical protein
MGGLGMIVVLMGIFAVSRIVVDFGQGFPPVPEVNTKNSRALVSRLAR